MVADPVDLLGCAGHADERPGEATHQGHQTASALVVVLAGDLPTALMIAGWRAASVLSVSSAVIVASAGTTMTPGAGRSRGWLVTGTVRPAPVVTVRPVSVTSARIGGIEGPAPGRWACAVERMPMSAVSAELEPRRWRAAWHA